MNTQPVAEPTLERRLVQDPRSQLAAVVAHQLRNRLSRLVFGVEAFTRHEDTDPTLVRAADRIRRGVDELVVWFDRFAEMVRVMSGTSTLRSERVDLVSLVSAEIARNESLVVARQQQLRGALPTRPVWVDGDALNLQVLFANLVTNAAKYSEVGGEIDVSMTAGHDEVWVTIVDRGIGIAKNRLGSIFEPFSVDAAERSLPSGIGAGLFLARSIARLHGGEVDAHSDGVGRGSRFVVTLPIARGSELQQVAEGTPRALVAHPDPGRRGLLSAVLRSWGYHVRDVDDAVCAVAAAREHVPSVVLIDRGMSAATGHLLPMWVRELSCVSGTRLVLVSDDNEPLVPGYDCQIAGAPDMDLLHALLRSS